MKTKRKKEEVIEFSTQQEHAIKMGAMERARLVSKVKESVSKINTSNIVKHTYISSPAGLGKTFTITRELEKSKIPYSSISGVVSLFALATNLATLTYLNQKGKLVVVIDDCDMLLEGTQNINVMKNILEGERKFKYEKMIHIDNYNELQQEAINWHISKNPEKLGFVVDCGRINFIWASNKKLPTEDDARKKPKLSHLHAIRSRCDTHDFDLSFEKQWGWLVDVTIKELKNKLSLNQKMILLDWMYNNWNNLTERSLRAVNKLSDIMINKPKGYRDEWEMQYLKK